MTVNQDERRIIDEALKLPAAARAALAGKLFESLDREPDPDPDAEAAWETEIAARVAEIDSGTAKLVPWSEVRKRLGRD